MINITDKTKCCGCNACAQICPKHCITMHEDKEGFLYPMVDKSVCIDCGLCNKVCPIINPYEPKQPLEVLAARNKNDEQRLQSSSGGLFILLAKHIIGQNGIVFGARFDKNWEVEHGYAETLDELPPLMRSKYVQSRIGNAYKEAEKFLKQGRRVMFVGTSCQITGLKKYLRKEYDNLLAVDFICHGVPSPGIWRQYLQEIRSKQNEATKKNIISYPSLKSVPVITGINFRGKQHEGYTWKKFGFVVNAKISSNDNQNTVILSENFSKNLFMKGFLSNLYLRPSCYHCVAKNGACESDLTIADFWGIQNYHPEFDDDQGTNIVFVHSPKGEMFLEALSSQLETVRSSIVEGTASNPSYLKPVPIPQKYSVFWRTYARTQSVCTSVETATHRTIRDKIVAKLKYYLRKIYTIKKTNLSSSI